MSPLSFTPTTLVFCWLVGTVNWLEKIPHPCLLTLSPRCICWPIHYPNREPIQFLHTSELKESTFHCWGFTFSLKIASWWVFFLIHAEHYSIIDSFDPYPHAESIISQTQRELAEALVSCSAVYLFIYPWLEPCFYILQSGWEPFLSMLQTRTPL